MRKPEWTHDTHRAICKLEDLQLSQRYPIGQHQLRVPCLVQIFQCDLIPKRAPKDVRASVGLGQSFLNGNDGQHNLSKSHHVPQWQSQ